MSIITIYASSIVESKEKKDTKETPSSPVDKPKRGRKKKNDVHSDTSK